jgi:hypothetical protein
MSEERKPRDSASAELRLEGAPLPFVREVLAIFERDDADVQISSRRLQNIAHHLGTAERFQESVVSQVEQVDPFGTNAVHWLGSKQRPCH